MISSQPSKQTCKRNSVSEEHARLSFSASERWLRCPASVYMSEQIPEKGESVAAEEGSFAREEGSFAHKVLEQTLNAYLLLGDSEVLEPEFPEDKDTSSWESPEMMQDYIQQCVDFIVSEYENFPGDNVKIWIEELVDCQYMTGRDDTWGTADVRIESTTNLGVYDLKYGKGIFVEADTSQNRLYLLGGMCPTLRETRGVPPWKVCSGWIMQPRFEDQEGEIFRGMDYEPQELLDWMDTTVKPAIGLTDHPLDPIAGEKQCRFCRAKPTCSAAQEMLQESLPFEAYHPVEVVVTDNGWEVDKMDIERLVTVHDNIPFINSYLKSVTKRLHQLLQDRDPRLHGQLKLVRTRKATQYNVDENTVITNLVAGRGRTVKDGYIPKKKFVKEVPLSAAQMLKLNLNKAQKSRLQEYVSKSAGSLSIVPWSDERENAFPPLPFEASLEYDFL